MEVEDVAEGKAVGGDRTSSSSSSSSFRAIRSVDQLPSAVIESILTRLDVSSLCSVASTCKSLRRCAFHALSFLPAFHLLEIAPTLDLLWPLLPPNPHLHTVRLDCSRLDDTSMACLVRPSLHEVCLLNCWSFSGALLSVIGRTCPQLRSLSLGSLAEQTGAKPSVLLTDLEQLLDGCSQLESLCLGFDLSVFDHSQFGQLWENTCGNLSTLKFGYISVGMVITMLNAKIVSPLRRHTAKPPNLINLQKLCLSVDYINDTLISCVSQVLVSLTHLDLQDTPFLEPTMLHDLTNAGLQLINGCGKLKHISLIRNTDFLYTTCFRRVNDLGILLMADTCLSLESICLGGFCRVTDTGFRAILHSCPSLKKLKVFNGSQVTDLVFHDIYATSLSLTHVSLRRCTLLTNLAILRLSSNRNLSMLDLRDCRNLGDEALKAVGSLPKLQTLLLDGTDISDVGMSYLGLGLNSLVSLSIRGCRRLTDDCVSAIFGGSLAQTLHMLDFSRASNISDNGILFLAKSGVSLVELRMRDCPLIGDTSVMALASMHINGIWNGSSLKLLDMYECRGITQLAFRWFKKPYFPRLRWLGVKGSTNRDLVDALLRSRPLLHVASHGEEIGATCLDPSHSWHGREWDEVDELEQWLLEDEYESEEEYFDVE